jgi:hypothetical protein
MKSKFKIAVPLVLLVLFTILSTSIFAQKNKRYFLEKALNSAVDQTPKTEAYLALGEYFMKWDIRRLDSLTNVIRKVSPKYNQLNRSKLVLFAADACIRVSNYSGFLEVMVYFKDIDYSNYSSKLKADIYEKIGFTHTFNNERRLSKSNFNKGLIEAKKARDFSKATSILYLLAFEALINKEKEKALTFTEQAIEYANKAESEIDLAYCFNMQANIFHFYGENENSVRKNFMAYELARSAGSKYDMSQFAYEIGQTQEFVRNFSGAKYYYKISLKHAEAIHDFSKMGQALSAMANLLRNDKKHKESLEMNLKALILLDPKVDEIRIGDIEKNIGQNYTDLKLNSEALEHYKISIEYYLKGKSQSRIAEIYFRMGQVFFKQNQLDKSLDYLLKSVDIARNFGSPKAKFKTFPMIAEIYKSKGKKDLALRYMGDYITFMEEENAVEASNKIAELGETFRSEERDRMIAEQADSLEKQKHMRKLTESELENATLRSRLQTYFLIAFIIVLLLATTIGVFRSRQAAIQRKRKQAEMSQTLLRSQMNPHFIFNAMSVIQSYIYDNDVENSSRFLVSFSRLIRLILENSPKEFISIDTEIDILNKYLETQKLRFEKRFDFEIICPESLIFEKVLIPPMIMQPFVENAIEHGELHQIENGKITIRFSKKVNMLQIEIEDNGVGRKKSAENKPDSTHTSMATSITEERIRIMNDKENTKGFLSINDRNQHDETGTVVLISLPFKKEISLGKINHG